MESPYLISRRNRECFGTKEEPKKEEPKPIAKRSEKMKAEMKVYIKAAKEFLAKPENKECAIKLPGCTGKATVIHHSAGRIGAKLHDQEDWMPSCSSCNVQVEVESLLAKTKGLKKSKFKI